MYKNLFSRKKSVQTTSSRWLHAFFTGEQIFIMTNRILSFIINLAHKVIYKLQVS